MSRTLAAFLGIMASLLISTETAAEDWALKGDLAESCCCQPACPCIFSSAPTLGHCEGSSLFEIEEGHYGDVRVDGLNVVFAYRFGEWVRLYVDETASDEQRAAVEKLLNQDSTFGAFFAGDAKVLSNESAQVSVKKTESTIEFSVPDSKVKLEAITGPNGEPARIENLSIPWFVNGYTQYRALTTKHKRGDAAFEYSGTNGATSHVDADGDTEK